MLLKEDYDILTKYSKNAKLSIDLGTFYGESAIGLAENSEKVITIDLFEDGDKIEDPLHRKMYKVLFKNSHHTYDKISKRLSECKNITVFKDKTISKQFDYVENVDCLFIDADHSYYGVKKDFEYWFPKVVKKGYIIFHDSYPPLPCNAPVQKFLKELDLNLLTKCQEGGNSTVFLKE